MCEPGLTRTVGQMEVWELLRILQMQEVGFNLEQSECSVLICNFYHGDCDEFCCGFGVLGVA